MASGGDQLIPGFRFHPTDEELVMYYLKRKVMGRKLCEDVISELDIYKFEPSDLPDKASLKSRDLNWYFFCPRGNKYVNGVRLNRATEFGYWKATGNDRSVHHCDRIVGKIKTLVFHSGKPPKGDRTDWVLHEYRLEDDTLAATGVVQDSYVICKVFHKGGFGPRNGEQYGAPFKEEEWEYDDDNGECESVLPAAKSDFGNIASMSLGGKCDTAENNCHLTMASSEVVVDVNLVEMNPVALDSGGLESTSSHVVPGATVELDKMLAMYVGSPDLVGHEKEKPTELLAAEVDLGVYDQLDDFSGCRSVNYGQYLPSLWEASYLDEHLYLEMNDLA